MDVPCNVSFGQHLQLESARSLEYTENLVQDNSDSETRGEMGLQIAHGLLRIVVVKHQLDSRDKTDSRLTSHPFLSFAPTSHRFLYGSAQINRRSLDCSCCSDLHDALLIDNNMLGQASQIGQI